MLNLCEVILEVVKDAHNGAVVTVVAARIEGLEANVTQSDTRISPIIRLVMNHHFLQVVLYFVHLYRERLGDKNGKTEKNKFNLCHKSIKQTQKPHSTAK